MRKSLLVLVCVFALLLANCAAVLVGGLIWKSSKSKSEKAAFLVQLREINLEREKAGLAPLDKCIEMYHFDPGWARQTADCRQKIDSLLAAGIAPDSTKVFDNDE